MKNRIESKFDELKKQGRKAFIPFVTAGDPTEQDTYDVVMALAENGADIIELGVPFSDPIAEGPVIQEANIRAAHMTMPKVFDLAGRIRASIDKPILFLMYYNQIYHYGAEAFMAKCAETGVDGLIIPDLPLEEREEIKEACDKYNIIHIALITPTSGSRIKEICEGTRGYLYCVSSVGVTGVRQSFDTDFSRFMGEIKSCSSTPAAIGFGISTPEQVKELKKYSDGIIIGSAIVKLLAASEDKPSAAAEYARSIRRALDE